MSLQQQTSATCALMQLLVSAYFSPLTSVLIVYDGKAIAEKNTMQQEYLDAVHQAFQYQSLNGNIIGLQWLDVQNFNDDPNDEMDDYNGEFEEHVLNAVNIVTEGFITILKNTSRFLHARYYATRYATLRLKDKIYLFLCEHENPVEFLASELLQFYPHHLMVTPPTTNDNLYKQPETDAKKKCGSTKTNRKTQKPKTIQTYEELKLVAKETPNKNFTMSWRDTKGGGNASAATSPTPSTSSSSSSSSSSPLTQEQANIKYHDINFELWTQRYVGAEGNLNATHLDTFWGRSRLFAKNVELYPNKLQNLERRVMRVGSLTYVPYVKTNYVAPGEGEEDSVNTDGPDKTVMFQGAEAELVRTFCQIRNCHLRIIPYPPDDWGIILDNGTTEGMLGDLYEQHMEMAIGCIYNWYNNLMEVSQFIARSAVTIMGPGPKEYPRWRTNIMPFSTALWIFIFMTMISCSLVFLLFKYSANRLGHMHSATQKRKKKYGLKAWEKTLLDVFAVFIQQPSADTALRRMATRIFLGFLLCATITLESTYSGQLKSILTMPLFNAPVDTIQKWSLTNWKWGTPSIIWVTTVDQSDIEHEKILTQKFEVRDYDFLYNASFRDDYGLGLERLYSGSLNVGDYITMECLSSRTILKDDLYFDWTRAVSIMGWPMMPLLDQHILFCLETGLYIYWEKYYKMRFTNMHMQNVLIELSTGHIEKLPPQKLSIEHISGPLFILLFGHLTALFVFALELLRHRVRFIGYTSNQIQESHIHANVDPLTLICT
ncbi:ionotropic receptor 92a [Haematobia irritans]|uniref:ionotropic receptor 92a n=1 Tax=Haematobia irritans TaxID=7368 RepID=UPI003F4F970B